MYLKDVFESEFGKLAGPVSGHDIADGQSCPDGGPCVAEVHVVEKGLEVGLGEGQHTCLAARCPLDELIDPWPLVQLDAVECHGHFVQVFEGFLHGLVTPSVTVEGLKVGHKLVLVRSEKANCILRNPLSKAMDM